MKTLFVAVAMTLSWVLILLTIWSLISAVRDALRQARRMHAIPCPRCRFFSNNTHLKCCVHPHVVMTESACGCRDFEPDRKPLRFS